MRGTYLLVAWDVVLPRRFGDEFWIAAGISTTHIPWFICGEAHMSTPHIWGVLVL